MKPGTYTSGQVRPLKNEAVLVDYFRRNAVQDLSKMSMEEYIDCRKRQAEQWLDNQKWGDYYRAVRTLNGLSSMTSAMVEVMESADDIRAFREVAAMFDFQFNKVRRLESQLP